VTGDAAFAVLSDRARGFLVTHGSTRPAQSFTVDVSKSLGSESELRPFVSRLEQVDARFSGLQFPVLGGQLAGTMRLGLSGQNNVWRAAVDILVARMATHDSAQCALVISSGGQFGCSWSGEFTPLFDSVDSMLEDVAVWGSLPGWRYVAFLDVELEGVRGAIGDLTADPDASGDLSQWWFGDGVAVSMMPYLNPRRSELSQITVLAESAAVAEEIRERMTAAPQLGGIEIPVKALGRVPMLAG
jgi:hypothetical protein